MDWYLFVIWAVLRTVTMINASAVWFGNVYAFCNENIASGKATNQSSTFTNLDSSRAVDGCVIQYFNSGCCSNTGAGQTEAHWQVDLQKQFVIDYVTIINRNEGDLLKRLAGYEVYLSDTPDWRPGTRCHKDTTPDLASMSHTQNVTCPGVARYLTIYNDRRVKAYPWYSDTAWLELCEVQIYGCLVGKYGNGNCNNDCINCHDDTCMCDTTSGICGMQIRTSRKKVCYMQFYLSGNTKPEGKASITLSSTAAVLLLTKHNFYFFIHDFPPC